jgi:hypothetical protein
MANDDKIDAIGGISDKKGAQDLEKAGGANFQPPAAPKPPEAQQQPNPLENVKDKINISDEAKSL